MNLSSLIEKLNDFNAIFHGRELGNRLSLWSSYRRIRKTKKITKGQQNGINKIKLLNYTVEYFNPKSLNYTFREIFLTRDYFFSSEKRSPFIIDCGSNIGLSILFYKILFPESRIIGIEPDKTTFERLIQNVTGNKLTNVTLINKAISNEAGLAKFYSDPNNPGYACMSLIKERVAKKAPMVSEETVETVLLSELISGRVDFLKMDVEGVEGLALQELAAAKKLSLIDKMVIEYHHHIMPDEDNFSKILATLEENGFGYQLRTGGTRLPERANQDILIFAYRKGNQA